MAAIKTVRIQDPGFPDGILINESDFDSAVHHLYGETDENMDDLTRAELVERAESMGIEVPGRATKAEIVALIEDAGA